MKKHIISLFLLLFSCSWALGCAYLYDHCAVGSGMRFASGVVGWSGAFIIMVACIIVMMEGAMFK